MAEDCDFGLMIWDCKSPGTLSNVIELLQHGKKSVVYLRPLENFLTVTSLEDLEDLLNHMAPLARGEADKKIGLSKKLDQLRSPNRSSDDPRLLQAQIERHRAQIAHHEQLISALQAKLNQLSQVNDLFSR